MNKIVLPILSFSLLFITLSCGIKKQLYKNQNQLYHLRSINDSLFNSSQRINILSLPKKALNKSYIIDVAFSDSTLIKTSQLAANKNAVAAINGSFFNVDEGGSVTYFEINDTVINYTRDPALKWGKVDSILNGAIIINKKHKLIIQLAKSENFYKKSKKEHIVLISGSLLIHNSKLQALPDLEFTHKRHPRTCLGIAKDSIFFITIDGRSEIATGMNLYELQVFLYNLGCSDAINLDGGGSTTIWTKEKGVVNTPSDKKGERTVANALIILAIKNEF